MSAKKVYEKIGELLEKKPRLVIFLAIVLMFVSLYGAGMIEHKSGTETFVKRDSEIFQNYDHLYKQNFGSDAVVVLIESDNVLDAKLIESISDFEQIISKDKDAMNVLSIASLLREASFTATGRSDMPDDATINALITRLPSEYVDRLVPDPRHTIVMVQMPGTIDDANKKRLLGEVKRSLNMVDFPAGTTVTATGEPAFMIAMSEEITKSLGSMLALAFVLMVVALLMVFRHVRWCLLTIPVVLIGLVWTFGAMGILGFPMTMASMAVFPILIGLGADYAIQFHNRVEEELAKGECTERAIVETIKHTGPSVGIALVATALGFFALFISPVPMIQEFGKMSLVGVILCYLAAMLILVPLLYLLHKRDLKKECNGNKQSKVQAQTDETLIGKVLVKVSSWTARHPIIVIALATMLAVAGLYADERVGVQTNTKEFVPQDMQALLDLNKLNDIMGGSDHINVIIRADDILDPELVQWMVDFAALSEERHSQISSSSSIGTLVSSAYGSVPGDRNTIGAIVDRMPTVVVEQYIDGKNLGVLNLGLVRGLDTKQTASVIETVEKDMEWFAPPVGVTVTATGMTVTGTSIIGALTSGRTTMGYLGMAIIFLGMLVIYRDLIKSVATILPIVMVTGWLGGVMYLLGMKYNPLTATLGALAIGIGAEFTILMLERYYEEREKGLEPFTAMEMAASKIGPAIIASGFTVIFGFSALIISSFPMLRDFGIVTVIAVAFSLFSTIVVLPPIMVNLDKWQADRKTSKHYVVDKVNV